MKKVLLPLILIVGILLLYLPMSGFAPKGDKHEKVDFSISCEECHAETTPGITKDWQDGQHGKFKVGCFICHGDGVERFQAKPGDESCISCHSDYEVDWSKSNSKSCFDCHGGHTLKFHN